MNYYAREQNGRIIIKRIIGLGMLLSPVHRCLLITKDYFRESFRYYYRRIAWPLFCLGLAAGTLVPGPGLRAGRRTLAASQVG